MHAQRDSARPVPGTPPETSGTEAPADGEADPRAGIERAVAALDDVDARPLAEHVARFEDVHSALAAALSSIDKV